MEEGKENERKNNLILLGGCPLQVNLGSECDTQTPKWLEACWGRDTQPLLSHTLEWVLMNICQMDTQGPPQG